MFPGHDVPLDDTGIDGLEPYRSLDVARLKVVGRGHFDATPFLDDDLSMAYRFPDVLQYDLSGVDLSAFHLKRDPACEVAKLARLGMQKGCFFFTRLTLKRRHLMSLRGSSTA
jgi:hypothetical protein